MIEWMKYRWFYFLISSLVIGVGVFALFKWGLKVGIDFTGGVIAEYKLASGENKVFRYGQLSYDESEKIRSDFRSQGAVEIRFENVGPSVGPELIRKTIYALVISTFIILLWIAYQFKSVKFGVSATLATLHDSLVLLGTFAIFGHFLGAEIDFLFVTAILTVLSFSVHDTIVVFDRVRELRRKVGGNMMEMANQAIGQTMVRSLNNSFTIIFMLVALILLGGSTIRWFAVALLVGTVSGTYSSPFVAVAILVTWDELVRKFKK